MWTRYDGGVPASPLPVDEYIPDIVDALRRTRAAVVVAAPGAGKTTRVPPALVDDGAVLLLQPRRVAARAIARRIAGERGWTAGAEVGWHVRFDRQFSRATKLLVATEGILTARLQQDPLLSEFHTIVIDEFHERSIHADIGIALAKQAWLARDDLRIVVMSATLDAQSVSTYLRDCPVFDIPGRLHSLSIEYRPGGTVAGTVAEVASATLGQILCFLPGAAEVRRAADGIRARLGTTFEVMQLHGSLDPEEQDRAVSESSARRVIVATNIAETSLTVPGVTVVVDTGVHKVARYDPQRGLDTLELERITADSADQRAGRAGRIAPGIVMRLWSESDRLRRHRDPDIRRVDLSGPLLDILSWGGDPRSFDWFESPGPDALSAGLELLQALGAIDDGCLTNIGRGMSRLPVHPRLARILLEARGSPDAALACAILSDRQFLPLHPAATSSDLLSSIDRSARLPPHITRAAKELERLVPAEIPGSAGGCHGSAVSETHLRKALLAGYPDRVAQRRAPGQPRVLMASGHGGTIGPESGVREGEYIVALDVQGGRRGEQSEARIRMASAVDKDWLRPTAAIVEHEIDSAGTLRAYERQMYGAIVLRERVTAPDIQSASRLLADHFVAQPMCDDDEQLIRRLRFAELDFDLRALAERAASDCRSVAEIDLASALDWNLRRTLDRLAPATFVAPSGRTHRIEYEADGSVSAAVKLQELFGLAETPGIGDRRVPLRLKLLAPNARPVQTTMDLRSFWDRTYPEVRKELRGRYPRHPWPDDPWNATPTARTTRRHRS